MKILIIDDEILIKKSLSYVCQIRGHNSQESSSAKTGLQIWKKWHPDIIFLDLILPDQNGLDLMNQAPPSGNVVLMSAYSKKITGQERNYLFITKPFENIFETFDQAVSFFQKIPHDPDLPI